MNNIDDSFLTQKEKRILNITSNKMVDQIEKNRQIKFSNDDRKNKESSFYSMMVKMISGNTNEEKDKKMSKVQKLLEALWSADVDTKWKSPEGLFTKSADEIAKVLHSQSNDLKQAMSRLQFYMNRAGKNLSKEEMDKLNSVEPKLRKLFGV